MEVVNVKKIETLKSTGCDSMDIHCNTDRAGLPQHDKLPDNKYKRLDILGEEGLAELPILSFAAILILMVFVSVIATGFACRQKAVVAYMWFGEAMEYAAQAANMDGDTSMVELREDCARAYFFNRIEEFFDEWPYPYKVTSFYAVKGGDDVPGMGIARAPGYVAEMDVTVFSGYVPWVGTQTIDVPMRYYAIVKSTKNIN